MTMKATTAATAKKVIRCEENQSSSWPLSRMNSSEPNVRPSRPKPRKSSLMPPFCEIATCFFTYGGSSTMREVRKRERRQMGTLRKKIQRQSKWSVM